MHERARDVCIKGSGVPWEEGGSTNMFRKPGDFYQSQSTLLAQEEEEEKMKEQ